MTKVKVSLGILLFGLMQVSMAEDAAKDLTNKANQATTSRGLEVEKVGAYERIDLERYIKKQRPDKKGTKTILPIKRVKFDAALMSKPKKGKFTYIYTALDLMRMTPMPVIKHQAFVQANDGKIISVYLEEHFAKALDKHIKLGNIKIGNKLGFKGYHSYNYKRGPAMVMEGLFDLKLKKLTKDETKEVEKQANAK